LDALADDSSTWRANPTWRGTPIPPEALPPQPLVLRAPDPLPAATVDLRLSDMPRSMSRSRSEVERREKAHQVVVEPGEGGAPFRGSHGWTGGQTKGLCGRLVAQRPFGPRCLCHGGRPRRPLRGARRIGP
jgi:hypothetical protein